MTIARGVRGRACGRTWLIGCLAVLGAALGGCGGRTHLQEMACGDYGAARAKLESSLEKSKTNRDYVLSRLDLSIATLADGDPLAAETPIKEVYDTLTTRGVNEGKGAAATIVGEQVKVWKGEPFEQAFAFTYTSAGYAMRGEWDNARTAAAESLFFLANFGRNAKGEYKTTEEIATEAAKQDVKSGAKEGTQYLDTGFQKAESNFTLGYLMTGLSAQALGRSDEARDNFNKAVSFRQSLVPLTDQLLGRDYNTVLLVDVGKGPEKKRYGMDNAFAKFVEVVKSNDTPLTVTVGSAGPVNFPIAVDVNEMAKEHFWNNMEDVRIAKSRVGTALVTVGLATAAGGAGYNASQGRNTSAGNAAEIAGVAAAGVGLLMKLSAAADLTHAQYLPQRVYLVPLKIPGPDTCVTLDVADQPGTHLTLHGLSPPTQPGQIAFRYVRAAPEVKTPPAWASAAAPVYGNDWFTGKVSGDTLPYILGGTCLKRPTATVLKHYQSAGNLTGMSLTDLENLYHEEGIYFDARDRGTAACTHVLEGGKSMIAPLAGTAGYERLFCQPHSPYSPSSKPCSEMAAKCKPQGPVQAAAAGK